MKIVILVSQIGGNPPMYTYIIHEPLRIIGLHYAKFLHHTGKLLLNMSPSEPLALMKKLPYFDNPIVLDILLVGAIIFGVHDPIKYLFFNVVRIEFCRGQVLCCV